MTDLHICSKVLILPLVGFDLTGECSNSATIAAQIVAEGRCALLGLILFSYGGFQSSDFTRCYRSEPGLFCSGSQWLSIKSMLREFHLHLELKK